MTAGDVERYVLITGASRGIGAATARLVATQGWNVAITYKGNRKAAEAVLDDVRRAGRMAVALQYDSMTDAAETLFAECDAAELGTLEGLVNNAGITGPIARLSDVAPATVAQVMQINVTAVMLCMQQAIHRMSTRFGGSGGAIVNLSSRAGQLGGGGEWIHYGASKGAVDAMTVGAARELGAEGIRVNAVAPGLIATEIHETAGDPGRLERLMGGVPMARAGSAEEVAAAVMWLMSDTSAYVSGAILPVSGAR